MRFLRISFVLLLAMFCASACFAQADQPAKSPEANSAQPADDISGMYSFLRDGEFVQVTVEDGVVSGFVSRYGDSDTDKDSFLDQFFSKASLVDNKLSFTTKPVHNEWFEFAGTVERNAAKKQSEEGYRVLRGKLTQFNTDANKKTMSKVRDVVLKSFPQEDSDAK